MGDEIPTAFDFFNQRSEVPRNARRSSILKPIDLNTENYKDEKRQSRRISFAQNIYCQEVLPDGTTQVITEALRLRIQQEDQSISDQSDINQEEISNDSNNDEFNTTFFADAGEDDLSITADEVEPVSSTSGPDNEQIEPKRKAENNELFVEPEPKKPRKNKKDPEKVAKSFQRYMTKQYDISKDDDYNTIFNTSVNKFGEQVACRTERPDITKLFAAEDKEAKMDITRVSIGMHLSKEQSVEESPLSSGEKTRVFSRNNSGGAMSEDSMELTDCLTNKTINDMTSMTGISGAVSSQSSASSQEDGNSEAERTDGKDDVCYPSVVDESIIEESMKVTAMIERDVEMKVGESPLSSQEKTRVFSINNTRGAMSEDSMDLTDCSTNKTLNDMTSMTGISGAVSSQPEMRQESRSGIVPESPITDENAQEEEKGQVISPVHVDVAPQRNANFEKDKTAGQSKIPKVLARPSFVFGAGLRLYQPSTDKSKTNLAPAKPSTIGRIASNLLAPTFTDRSGNSSMLSTTRLLPRLSLAPLFPLASKSSGLPALPNSQEKTVAVSTVEKTVNITSQMEETSMESPVMDKPEERNPPKALPRKSLLPLEPHSDIRKSIPSVEEIESIDDSYRKTDSSVSDNDVDIPSESEDDVDDESSSKALEEAGSPILNLESDVLSDIEEAIDEDAKSIDQFRKEADSSMFDADFDIASESEDEIDEEANSIYKFRKEADSSICFSPDCSSYFISAADDTLCQLVAETLDQLEDITEETCLNKTIRLSHSEGDQLFPCLYSSLEGFDAKKYNAAYTNMDEEKASISFVFGTISVVIGFGPVLRTFNSVPVKSINLIRIDSLLRPDEPLTLVNNYFPLEFTEKHKPVFKAAHCLILSWFEEAKEQLLYRYKTSDLLHELLNEIAQPASRALSMIAELRCCDAKHGMTFVGKADDTYEFSFQLYGIRRFINIVIPIEPKTYPYGTIRTKLTFDSFDRVLYKPEAYPSCLQSTRPGPEYVMRLLSGSQLFVKAQRAYNAKKKRERKHVNTGKGDLLMRSTYSA